VSEITRIKRCEQCKSFLTCKIYIIVIENFKFLSNILDIKEPESIAKYCRIRKPIPRSEQLTMSELRDFFGFI